MNQSMNPFSIHKSHYAPKGILVGSGEVPPDLHGLPIGAWRGELPLDWAYTHYGEGWWGESSEKINDTFPPYSLDMKKMMILGLQPDFDQPANPIPFAELPAFQDRIVTLITKVTALYSTKYWIVHNEPNIPRNWTGTIPQFFEQALAAAVAIKTAIPNAYVMTSMASLLSAEKELEHLARNEIFRNAFDCLDFHQYDPINGAVEMLIGSEASRCREAGLNISLTETSPIFYGQLPRFFTDPRENKEINNLLTIGSPLKDVWGTALYILNTKHSSCIYAPVNATDREARCLELMRKWLLAAKANDYAFIGPFPIYQPPMTKDYWVKPQPVRSEAVAKKDMGAVREFIISNPLIKPTGELSRMGLLVKEMWS